MKKLFGRRPSASMVVAIIALIVALGGTAVAKFGPFKGNKIIKKHSLSGNRLKDHTVGGTQIKVSSLPKVPSARTADALGGIGPSGYQSTGTLLFASVKTSATGASVVHGRGAIGAGRANKGIYFVSFNRPIANCTWIATYGSTVDGVSAALTVTVEGRDFVGSPDDVVVRERNTAGTETDGAGFHVEVLCP